MASFMQLEEGHFTKRLLPPLRELSLEIQVNRLIQEYLFSSNADEMRTSLHDELPERKQNKACATDMRLWSACNAPCVNSTKALDDNHKRSPHDSHHKQNSQASLTLHSITCMEDYGIDGKDQTVISNALQTANNVHEASLATLSVESGGKLMHKTAHLTRVGTFPCTSKVELQVGMQSKVNMEIKASHKKPPRPPKLPKSELSSSLPRCCPGNGAYLQTSRRERKRKATATATATSSVNPSIWALLFTLCFTIIMIAQGFPSQDRQSFSAHGSDASSPTQTFMRASNNGSPEEASLAGAAERQASMDGALPEREASLEGGVLAQPYVMRKVQFYSALQI